MKHWSFVIALSLFAQWTSLAAAQTQGFFINRFDVSERGSDWFVGDSLDLRGAVRPAVGFVLDYAHKPLVLYTDEGDERAAIVRDQFFGHFGASVVLADRLRLAINLPVAFMSRGASVPYLATTVAAESGTTLGDLRLAADVRLLGRYGGPFSLALGAQLYLPTGSRTAFTGDGNVRISPHLLVAGRAGLFQYAVRAAFNYRGQDELLTGVATGTEVNFAVSAGLSVMRHKLLFGPELWGSTVVVNGGAFQKETTPLEFLLGAHWRPKDFRVGVGVGPGLTRGMGTPDVRVVGMFEWAPSYDTDGDGIIDEDDACPEVKGVPNADPNKHGCPPDDRDRDGFPDEVDACPDEPGFANADPAKNGCPIPGDRDGDGIPDEQDDCPDVAGVPSNEPGKNGCPLVDTDGDGIFDPQDACPTIAGPADPDPTKNGCPKARIEKDQIVITERVEFEYDSAKLLSSSNGILIAVMNILREHTEIRQVRVEGHTDDTGGPEYNQGLSERRAKSVVQWLVKHGVERQRLLDAGFGLTRPLDTNHNAAGRQRNRRVEFHIVDSATK